MSNRPILARIADALTALSGDRLPSPPSSVSESQERAIVQSLMPGGIMPSMAAATMVRAASPTEIKRTGTEIRRRGFNAHPVVHACIRVVTDVIASVPLVVLREKGDHESRVPESHELQRLLDYPAPRVTARQLRARFAVDFLGYGNALWRIYRAGNAPGRGRIVNLRPINAEGVQNVWVDREGDAARYAYSDWNGVVVDADAADVIHFRDIDMPRPYYPDVFGYPRGAAALASIASDSEATGYVRQVVTNDGTPTFVVLLNDEATEQTAKSMQDRYRERTVARGKRGDPAFFGSVKDIKSLGFTLSDLEFPDLRRVSREDICAAFGVDPRMIGIASATKDAGLSGVQYAEARTRLVQHTIEPMLSAFCDELNAWLAPEFGDVWIAPDHDVLRDLIENDTETSTRVRGEFKDSIRSWQETRRALKLSPQPEIHEAFMIPAATPLIPAALAVMAPIVEEEPATGESDPNAAPIEDPGAAGAGADSGAPVENVAATAMNGAQVTALTGMIEQLASKALPRPTVEALIAAAFPAVPAALIAQMLDGLDGFTPPAPAVPPALAAGAGLTPPDEGAEEEGDTPIEAGDDEEEEEARADLATAAPGDTEEEDAAPLDPRYIRWRAAMDILDRDEAKYATTAKSRFAAERRDIGAIFARAAEGILAEPERAATGDDILAEALRRATEGYAPGAEYHRAWAEAFRELVGNTYLAGASEAVGSASFNFTLQSPDVIAAIARRVTRLADFITDETARQVTAAVRAGELGGLSVREIGKLIEASVFGEPMTTTRSTRIARTESAGAMSQGGWDQAAEAGIYQSKEWLAFEDGRTRPTHSGCMAEGRIAIDEPFQSNGLLYPLDPNGDASEVINCRCTLLYYDEAAQ